MSSRPQPSLPFALALDAGAHPCALTLTDVATASHANTTHERISSHCRQVSKGTQGDSQQRSRREQQRAAQAMRADDTSQPLPSFARVLVLPLRLLLSSF
jgi:hypothetical protein